MSNEQHPDPTRHWDGQKWLRWDGTAWVLDAGTAPPGAEAPGGPIPLPPPPDHRAHASSGGRRAALIGAAMVAVLVVGGVSIFVATRGSGSSPAAAGVNASPSMAAPSPTSAPLQEALLTCSLTTNLSARIGDNNRTLTLDGSGEEDLDGVPVGDLACVLDQLDITDAAIARIDATRALDGMQEASWGQYTATWTYHPDAGLDITITQEDAS